MSEKNITQIKYNHLNLPTAIYFSNNNKINYIYNAAGQKISKTVHHNNAITTTEYLDGFQYVDEDLQFFPTSEGYVRKTDGTNRKWFDYVYNYTDHLGNIRLSYTTDPLSGSTNNIKILEENNYYPFGLKHGLYNKPARDIRPVIDNREIEMVSDNPYNYRYNGKEWQGELGLNVTFMDFRQYDNALGRFMNPDALSELAPMHTPYRFGFNNPVFWSDPTGLFEGSESMESFRYCPTCPESDNFDEFRDDPNTNYVYNDETGVVTEVIELPDVVADGEKSVSNIKKGVEALMQVGVDLGGFSSNLLKDRFKYGEKYGDKNITIRTRLGPGLNINSSSLKKLKSGGRLAGRIVKGLVVADVAMSGEIRASHVLTASMIGINAIPIAGNVVSGIYFGTDLIIMGANYLRSGEAKGIGDYLDEALDGGVILEAQDLGINYDGLY